MNSPATQTSIAISSSVLSLLREIRTRGGESAAAHQRASALATLLLAARAAQSTQRAEGLASSPRGLSPFILRRVLTQIDERLSQP